MRSRSFTSRLLATVSVVSLAGLLLLAWPGRSHGQRTRIYVGGNPGYYRTSAYPAMTTMARGAGFSYVAGYARPGLAIYNGSVSGLGYGYGGYYGYNAVPGGLGAAGWVRPPGMYGYPGSGFGPPAYGDPYGYPLGSGFMPSYGGYGYPGFGIGIGTASPFYGYGYRGFYPW